MKQKTNKQPLEDSKIQTVWDEDLQCSRTTKDGGRTWIIDNDSNEGLHTQGEWFLSGCNRENDPLYINVKTTDVDNEPIEIPIAKLLPTLTYISEEQAQANAELIVKAVNERKVLLDALKDMFALAEEMGMMLTSDQWNEKFRAKFNPIMTTTEFLIK